MIQFPKLLLNLFGWQKRKIDPDSDVKCHENILRYIFHKNQFSPNAPPGKSRVKYVAFSLGRDSRVSIYRTDGLTEKEILGLGNTYVVPAAGKPIKAWANLKANVILDNGLLIEADGIPHPRHANITSWPREQAKIKMLQVKLANEAELFIPE